MATRAKKASASSAKAKSCTSLTAPPPADFSKDEELEAYKEMLLIRRFEEKAGQLYGMGFIGGFCHLYIGQEAVVIGMQMAMEEGDQVITGYRDHGHMLATGMESRGVMAELTGRQRRLLQGQGRLDAHVLQGKDTSMAVTASSARRCRWAPASAFANKYRGNGIRVSAPISATVPSNQGQVYESFNMASLWKLAGCLRDREQHATRWARAVSRASAADRFLAKRGISFSIRRFRRSRRHGCSALCK
jgi:pyruvate dehydrogenase E1 component alpha subunit